MGISVEISMYPLQEKYKKNILDFIEHLRSHQQLTILTNNMSTRVFGEYDEVMSILTKEIKTSFSKPETVVVVMKMVGKNLEE